LPNDHPHHDNYPDQEDNPKDNHMRTGKIRLSILSLTMLLSFAIPTAAQTNMTTPLLDRELFFGDPEISGAQLSPDGRFIFRSSRSRR
jgi:hypothetical protein